MNEQLSDVTYWIQQLRSRKKKVVHFNYLKALSRRQAAVTWTPWSAVWAFTGADRGWLPCFTPQIANQEGQQLTPTQPQQSHTQYQTSQHQTWYTLKEISALQIGSHQQSPIELRMNSHKKGSSAVDKPRFWDPDMTAGFNDNEDKDAYHLRSL